MINRIILSLSLIVLLRLEGQTAQDADGNWPKEIDSQGMHLVIYQPQVDSWKKDHIEARSAVEVTEAGKSKPIFGIVSLTARTEVDKENRLVTFEDAKVTKAIFPSAKSQQGMLANAIRDSLPDWPQIVSLDRLLADLAISNAETENQSISLKNEPPKIIFSNIPAVLILIDGDPVYRNIQGTKYTHVINTPALLLFDSSVSRFYLDTNVRWMTATNLNGPWNIVTNPPSDLEQIKTQLMEEEQKDPHDHSKDDNALNPNAAPPYVYVSTVPAELIQTNGVPLYEPIPNTQLTYVVNTSNDIFVDVKTQNYYLLLAGRWFQAKALSGPWTWVPGEKLPRDFSRIPPESPKGTVLVSVPGTEQAKEAVIANQIPQTAEVKRSEAKLAVRYDGDPKFKPIEGTTMEYAINTSTDVIHAEGRYYAVQNAIWFVADSPLGPWVVADNIPAVIYTIPPSCPLFHVRYVYIYGATPDLVYFGYTPGYVGSFVYDGVVVFGTGWWYPGWYGDYWFAWPWTWGFGFHFGYWTGGWFWRPVGFWWYHNPWYMHRLYYENWNPHWYPGDRAWIRNNANIYNRWHPNTVVTRNNLERQRAIVRPGGAVGSRSDVYAGRNGQIYQHRENGWYQQNRSGGWRRIQPNPGLERQRQSRSLGQSRQGEFQNRGHVPGFPRTMPAPRMPGGTHMSGGRGGHR